MKILVLGGSGFLGSHVSDILTKKGNEVRIFDTKKSKWIKKKQKMYIGNILNIKSLEKAIKGETLIINGKDNNNDVLLKLTSNLNYIEKFIKLA